MMVAYSRRNSIVHHIFTPRVSNLPDLTLKRLGEKMDFEYKHTMYGSVLRCTKEQIWKLFLIPRYNFQFC